MFQKILYGGDYNPNQWPKEIWQEDMRLFEKAHINSASINIFSWAKIQPAEDVYDFRELDAIIDMLSAKDMDIVLATATAALPAWMFKTYPEVARTDFEGRQHKFGFRHNACPNSLVYQKYAGRIAEKLAERYGGHKNIVCWHINNEYGGECFCENCEKAFRVWLREKYKTIDALNKAWNMEFWGHTVYAWDEIVLPNMLSEAIDADNTAFAGISIDYRRFMSDSILENYKMERDAIRRHDAKTPITTNLMGTYKNLDYFKWAKEMDIVSWDNYPAYDTPWSTVAMTHDLMRGLKGAPFMLMEQTPSQQNWQPYNTLKHPGLMRAQSYQTIAHGADTIQFFQLRRSIGACEKFHGAVIGHAGTEDTRVFREVTQLGEELEKISPLVMQSTSPAEVGIVFDWDTYWALEYISGPTVDLKYVDQIQRHYRYFYDANIPVDMIPVDADFSRYKMVVAPVLYMFKDGMAEALETYVKAGGTLVTGFMSGIVDQSDNVILGGYPGPLRKLAGIWVEEIDAMVPGQENHVRFADGTQSACGLLCDIIHLENAEALAEYQQNFYASSPAITRNAYGQGTVYYIGTQLDADGLAKTLAQAAGTAAVQPLTSASTAVEVTRRRTADADLYFLINLSKEPAQVPDQFAGKINVLTNQPLNDAVLAPYDVAIVRVPFGEKG